MSSPANDFVENMAKIRIVDAGRTTANLGVPIQPLADPRWVIIFCKLAVDGSIVLPPPALPKQDAKGKHEQEPGTHENRMCQHLNAIIHAEDHDPDEGQGR